MNQSDIFRYVVAGLILGSLLGACVVWSVAAYSARQGRRGRDRG